MKCGFQTPEMEYSFAEEDQSKYKGANELQEIDAVIVNGSECLKDHPEVDYFYDDKWLTCVVSIRGQSTTCMVYRHRRTLQM